ncbi:hypothetical protein HPB49_005575 [Dermacentor silvarum]|uniref:Uncharacterized protein n=1 Tax=Dermacentor silvarum TaxID=543639 RepID=A0ACB8C7G6_DERSI|nr:hypothetical protein HPB49_005575 [Dermacentor silvarum]
MNESTDRPQTPIARMASTQLQPPRPLDTTGDTFHNWTVCKSEFDLFATATGLTQQPKEFQAATFLMTIGEDAGRTYYTLKFDSEDEKKDLKSLLAKFEAHYAEPQAPNRI